MTGKFEFDTKESICTVGYYCDFLQMDKIVLAQHTGSAKGQDLNQQSSEYNLEFLL